MTPRVGPGGELAGDPPAARLTARGRQLAAAYLRRYPQAWGKARRRLGRRWPVLLAGLAGGWVDPAEVAQAAALGVCEAAARFDPRRRRRADGRRVGFRGYAAYWISYRVGQVLDRRPWLQLLPGGDWPADPRGGEADPGPDPRLDAALGRLTAAERRAVELRHGLGGGGRLPWAAVAAALGVGVRRAQKVYRRALGEMREEAGGPVPPRLRAAGRTGPGPSAPATPTAGPRR